MIQQTPESDRFKAAIGESLFKASKNSRAVSVGKNDNVYLVGDPREKVYFIDEDFS